HERAPKAEACRHHRTVVAEIVVVGMYGVSLSGIPSTRRERRRRGLRCLVHGPTSRVALPSSIGWRSHKERPMGVGESPAFRSRSTFRSS
ncbi:MAG: hypothetical protein QGD95_04690, partial [Actinomycetota bacterium]|nr:hypothetical protein [Actinomycetota bacterium]